MDSSCKVEDKDMKEDIEETLSELPRDRESLIPALQTVQKRFGYLPKEALDYISEDFKIPPADVYGVATFYSQFQLEPQGEHTIRVCQGTACHIKGADEILEELQSELNIIPGEVTEDGNFTLATVRCLGCCSLAPVIMIDEDVHGNLTREKIPDILEKYK